MKFNYSLYFAVFIFINFSSAYGAQAVVQQQKRVLEQREMQNNTRADTPRVRPLPGKAIQPSHTVNSNASNQFLYNDQFVGMQQVLAELEVSSEIWLLMVDDESKLFVIDYYKEQLKSQGVLVRKDSMHYVRFIDLLFRDNSEMLYQPFEELFRISAVMEYDYDNGVDADLVARKILGEPVYLENKQRLGL